MQQTVNVPRELLYQLKEKGFRAKVFPFGTKKLDKAIVDWFNKKHGINIVIDTAYNDYYFWVMNSTKHGFSQSEDLSLTYEYALLTAFRIALKLI